MAKIRFTTQNLVDIVTDPTTDIVANNEETTLPVQNIQDMSRGKIYRSTASPATITITWPTTYTVSAITIGNHNFTAGTSVTCTFYDGTAGGGSPLGSNGGHTITAEEGIETNNAIIYSDIKNYTWYKENATTHVLEPAVGARSAVISIANGSGSNAGVFDVGRVIIGNALEATYNISYGHNLSFEEPTTQYRTDSGSLRSDMALPYKRFEFNMNTMSESDRQVLQRGFADVGKRRDFTVSVFPCDDTEEKKIDYSGIVKLTRIPKFQEFQHNWYKAKYVMEEV